METPHRKSKAWIFITITTALLILFIINAATFPGQSETSSADPVPLNVPIAVLFACLALASGIAANVAAYLNPTSSLITKIVSPFVILLVAMVVIPFFITLGLTMTG